MFAPDATRVTSTTDSTMTTRSPGLLRIPRPTIRVVAPAGGCGARNSWSATTVTTSEITAAATRRPSNPAWTVDRAYRRPVTGSASHPAATATTWPTKTLRGCAARSPGVSTITMIVGPRLGNSHGWCSGTPTSPASASATAATTPGVDPERGAAAARLVPDLLEC